MSVDECGLCGSEDIDDSGVVASDPMSGPVGYEKCNDCGARNNVDEFDRGWHHNE